MQVGRVVGYKIKNYNHLLLILLSLIITFYTLWKLRITNEILKAKSWPIFSCILTSRISLRGGFYDCYVQKILGNYLL